MSDAAAHAPAGAPFSRCPRCNLALRARTAFEAHGEVPGRVTRSGSPLGWCAACGKWYWAGSHVPRIVASLEAALGRPLAPRPGGAPPEGSTPNAGPGPPEARK